MEPSVLDDRVDTFEGDDGQWRWHQVAANNEIVCVSESFDSKSNAERAADRQRELIGLARLGSQAA